MKPRIKKLWIEALRSGEYKQGKYRLVNERGTPTKFCCLGVLTNLYVEATGDADVWERRDNTLDYAVQRWAGLIGPNPWLGPLDNAEGSSAIDLNDNGVPFPEIADLIEEYL